MLNHEPDFSEYYAQLQDHFDAGRWSAYLDMCANRDRATELLKIIELNNGASRLWPLVNNVWSTSNNIAADQIVWDAIWQYAYRRSGEMRRCRGLMRAVDRRVYESLPELVTAYRGFYHIDAATGYSWTLDRDVAVSFARRVGHARGRPLVATATIPRRDILAYFNEREEQEIVVNRLALDSYGDHIPIAITDIDTECEAA